jgi:hypothetical protein
LMTIALLRLYITKRKQKETVKRDHTVSLIWKSRGVSHFTFEREIAVTIDDYRATAFVLHPRNVTESQPRSP